MTDPIYKIIERLALIEGKITPVNVKHGLNKQQQGVPQLPALLKPRNISPTLTKKPYQAHPLDGYMVGENSLAEAMQEVEEDMVSRVKGQFRDYLEKLEKENKLDSHLVRKAKHDLKIGDDGEVDEDDYEPDMTGDLEQDIKNNPGTALGTGIGLGLLGMIENATWDSDVQPIGDPADTEVAHGVEDHIAASVAAPAEPMAEYGAPARTYTLEDGTCLEAYGDDDNGYEVRHGERKLPTRFPRIDHADMAVKLFQKRRQKQDLSQDYIEER